MHSSSSDRQQPKHLDKILFGVAGVYFLLVLMWLYNSVSDQKQQKTDKKNYHPQNTQFIAYLQQSLTVISKASTEKTLVNPQTNQSSKVAVIPPPPSVPERIVERIYVPMYPPTSSTPPSSTPQHPSPQKNIIPPPSPVSSTTPQPPNINPNSTTLPVPPEIAINRTPTNSTIYQLVGVLESGRQSTAIFTFDGLSRRFEIGEPVGSSGGILMGVENQKAIIYHNGQTKYLEVGQGF